MEASVSRVQRRFRCTCDPFEYALSRQRTEQKEGEKYHYRTILTNVLAMVLERATDTTLPKLLQSRIWSKLSNKMLV